ncbi:hypothetical protein [Polyangium jinanense]|uniref:Lipoprotein n=1 Tax=Polyangium jinanense TaxID=2829994 RepID=A0A9X3X0D2_9BACT|nr:hypothetical protein [Polyangium jinanense]MDC3954795.1 hypothetical protein [Polyangium jinanense]MDC3981434.1 hypothetical protein [Polyangium jinanense]
MLSFRLLEGVVLGTVLTLIGCGTAVDPGDFVESQALEPQGGSTKGTGGMNGLSPADYHANVTALVSALGVAAADPQNPSAVNPAIEATGLLATEGGREVFSYAARCTLPAGTQLTNGSGVYTGGGILTTTGSWPSAGLTTSQKEDALTCMVTHLNPFGAHVPFFLSGPSIAGTESSDAQGFTIEEAIWQVKLEGPNQTPIYYAWPRVDLLNTCGLVTSLTWVTRICGSALNTCGVQVRYDRATACTGSDGIFTCNGKPAVQTSLEESDLCILHLNVLGIGLL